MLVDVHAPLDPLKIDEPAYPRAEPSLAVTDLDIGESAVICELLDLNKEQACHSRTQEPTFTMPN